MPVSRDTFVVQVEEECRSAVVENLRTRERVWIEDVEAAGRQIARWLDPAEGSGHTQRPAGEEAQ